MEYKNTETNSNNKTQQTGGGLTVFLTGLCGLTLKSDLRGFLASKLDGFTNISLPKKHNSGYAFVDFNSVESVSKALEISALKYKGRELLLKPYIKGDRLKKFKNEVNSRRLFVSNIPLSFTDSTIKEVFTPYGDLETAYVIRDRDSGISKGFGYVIFSQKERAEKVANLKIIEKEGLYELKVKIHQPKTYISTNNGYSQVKNEKKEEKEHWVKPSQKRYFEINGSIDDFGGAIFRLNYDRRRINKSQIFVDGILRCFNLRKQNDDLKGNGYNYFPSCFEK